MDTSNQASLPDVASNRNAIKWTRREIACRLLWEIVQGPFFSWTPRQFWLWRRLVLRLFGAKIGQRVHVYPSVRIAIPWNLNVQDEAAIGDGAIVYSLGTVTIGRRATVSQLAHLCAGSHDYRDAAMPLTKPRIEIGEGAWVCAEAYVGPGVKIGARTIIGARAVVTKDFGDDLIVCGNPAKVLRPRPPFASHH